MFKDDGTSETIPVAKYYIERLTKEVNRHGYCYEKVEKVLNEVKEYCNRNNINI